VKRLVIIEQPAYSKCILAVTTIALFLIILAPNYSVLASTMNGGGDKPSSDTTFFRVLKGDLNVCSPNYQYNITICQMVMKNEELSPYVGKVISSTNSTDATNSSNSTNTTNSGSYPPLSTSPEMVVSEEQLQELQTNSSAGTPEGVESVRQNDTGTNSMNDTQGENVGKIYVDKYLQYEPLVNEQPLEGEIAIDNHSQSPWQNNQQPLFMNNQTVSSGVHDIEEPELPNDAIHQQDNHQDSGLATKGSRLGDDTDNPKADTSNSYSSIPIGMSLPLRN
jgi:hypothetical protein